MRKWLAPAAAVLVAAGAVPLAAPAGAATVPVATAASAAAACPSGEGVTAVVDFNDLGGGVTAGCDGDGGGKAATVVFRDAGYTLQYSQQPGMQGFVCKIQGKPADGDCAQTDRFWSLWWSDGTDGKWHFSNRGAGSLEVPDGGYVAFSWHEGGGDATPPDVAPTPHAQPQSGPDRNDGSNGGSGGNGGGTGGGSGGSGGDGGTPSPSGTADSAVPSATPSAEDTSDDGRDREAPTRDRDRRRDERPREDRARDRDRPSEQASAAAGIDEVTRGPDDVSLVSGEPAPGDEAFPAWLLAVLAAGVLGAAAAVPLLRRRAG